MISDEDAKEVIAELRSRAAACRKIAEDVENFPTENARLTSAANAWGYAADLVRNWIDRVNAAPPADIVTVARPPD